MPRGRAEEKMKQGVASGMRGMKQDVRRRMRQENEKV
jgi:hypothetical protein